MTSYLHINLRESLNDILSNLQSEGFLTDIGEAAKNISIEQPKDPSHGDFATNAAMVLARPAKKNPREIAEKIAEGFTGSDIVEKVEVAGPGFINFRLKQDAFNMQIQDILKKGTSYGHSDYGQNEKVMVEYCSGNPTGPIHVGHLRGTIYGAALSNLLKVTGYDVTREYYVNDAGGQVRVLVKSVMVRYRQLFGENVDVPAGCYPGEYVVDIAKALKDRDGDQWLSETDDEHIFLSLRKFCVDMCLTDIKKSLDAFNIEFDNFFSEWELHEKGDVEKAVKALDEKGYVYRGILEPPKGKVVEDYEPEEMTLFKSSEFGDDTDRPLYKTNGEATYFCGDVAYHYNKLSRGYKKLIDVFGADHAGTVKRLKSAFTALTGNKDALDVILMQMVRFKRNGEMVKMSKRAGTFITLEDIVSEVGGDAVRFTFLMRKLDTQFDFDLAKAVEKNNDNPVFYVQYGHARMCSVYRQQKELGIPETDLSDADLNRLTNDEEKDLLRYLAVYPLLVEQATRSLEPHRIAFYAHELASRFHTWYNAHKFLNADDLPTTYARLALLKSAQNVLVGALDVLGVSAPDKM